MKAVARAVLVAFLLILAACDNKPQAPQASAQSQQDPASVYDTVAAKGAGFPVGNLMAARTVYVFFDPQCPHCGRLWREAKPLANQVRMVWMPVRFLADISLQQGAALLASANPVDEMDKHEQSLLSGGKGLTPPAQTAPDLAEKVKANTALLGSIGGSAVPYLVFKNPKTGQAGAFEGATDTEGLKKLLGM